MTDAARRPFLIDTDTASDDAVALMMALRDPGVEVRAITTVAGNVPVEQATRNALYTAELCGRGDVSVYAGCARPLVRGYEDAQWFHGRDGLGDMNYPAPARRAEAEGAVEAMIRIAGEAPGLTIVTLGPLTNLATALARDPGLVRNVGRVVIMGGNPCCEGNVTPAAEYNVWVDPEAAEAVLRAGWASPPALVGWHLCRGEAVVTPEEMRRLRGMGRLGEFVVDCNRMASAAILTQTGEVGISLPDPTAMAVALDPGVVTAASDHLTRVSLDEHLCRGQTVVDRLNVGRDARNGAHWEGTRAVRVVWRIDVGRFKGMLFDSVRE